jgi:hypothetical protein
VGANATPQAKDRVSDHLARPVHSDVTAARGSDHGDALFMQSLGGREHVGQIRASPQGDDGLVFKQKQRVRRPALGDLVTNVLLQPQRLSIGHVLKPRPFPQWWFVLKHSGDKED